MADLWTMFCGESACSDDEGNPCGSGVTEHMLVLLPSSCINHAMILCFDVILLIVFFLTVTPKKLLYKSAYIPLNYHGTTRWHIISATFNGVLGIGYLFFGISMFAKEMRMRQTALPLRWWLLALFQGVTQLLQGLTCILRGEHFPRVLLQLSWILSFSFSGITCTLSLCAAIFIKQVSKKVAFDVLSFLGTSLLLLCASKGYKDDARGDEILYAPCEAYGSSKMGSAVTITALSRASFFSRVSFSWLNPLMSKGREKILDDEDMPKLCRGDRAEACYSQFKKQLDKRKRLDLLSPPSVLWALVSCHRKEILISGFFALLKVITLSSGPLLLNDFIEVAQGKENFENEGYVLAISFFFLKSIESLAQRQWYFRSRLIGLKVKSVLTATIYKKQLRLSNAAKKKHAAGEITNYVTVDAYRIGEFPFWFHQTWTTALQLCFALAILFRAVGLASIASLVVIIITVACNYPLAELQHKFQTRLMVAQDERLKASSEALVNMKVLKLYAWVGHFQNVIEDLREVEYKWLSAVQLWKAYNGFLFWSSPVLVSAATFGACYFLNVTLHASNVFTFVAALRLVQDPVRSIPEVIGVVIQAKVAFSRIVKFLEAPELENAKIRQIQMESHAVIIKSADFSWLENHSKPTLTNINLEVRPGEKVAICGEVGSGKSNLLAAILGEVPSTRGTIQVYGKISYVSQSAWIQTGTIRENILFGSAMDDQRYQDTLEKCSLLKDLELQPFGDLTEIGERGVNLSGGQKQRIQLARALYQDADVYLLDDPFSAVDAHTATSLFNEYVMEALSTKTVLLVTHQVDFLPAFSSVLLMSNGEIIHAAPHHQLLDSSQEFRDLVNAHKETAGTERLAEAAVCSQKPKTSAKETKTNRFENKSKTPEGDQLIKQEEREVGDTGLKPYIQYLSQNKGFMYLSIASLCHLAFVIGQILQNSWMAANVDNPLVSTLRLITVYSVIGFASTLFLCCRSLSVVALGLQSSKSLFARLLRSLFRAPTSFYDSTPLGRILSRVSSDLSIIDLDIPFCLMLSVVATINTYANLAVLATVTWQVLFVFIPMVYWSIRLEMYYFASAKELMRINGTTKSLVVNHLAESIAGSMTIRAFEEEDRFFANNLELIDINASPFFHSFAANEWLIQRLETLCAIVLSSSALCMVLLPPGTFSSGFIGMALSYGLSLNISLVISIQNKCTLANNITSVERLHQCLHIPSEAPEVIEENKPSINWPTVGKVEIQDLEIRYRPNAPLVLRRITCTFEGGHKIGVVGRTGSGKSTLIGALFRLVEPTGGKILVDGIDISKLGLHDLRSRFGIIPQEPTLFSGTLRYNLDPLSHHTDQEIWEVIGKCQLREAVQEQEVGFDSVVVDDGSNWSMGQRQLFCLGRALLKRSKILVLDEATASIDNATDLILQRTIRTEFADCTVITVAHRIPTVMDCTRVLAISDGRVVEFDEPMKLMNREGSLFGQLVKEYWSHSQPAELHEYAVSQGGRDRV